MSTSHDQSKRESSTSSTATQNNVAASEGSQTKAILSTGNRNTTIETGGTGKGNIHESGSLVVDKNSTVNIETLDAETISGAFGLTETVVNQLALLAGGVVNRVAQTNETSTAEMAKAFDRFGTDLSAVSNKAIDSAHPQNDSNKIILAAVVIGGVVWVASILRKKQP